MKKRVCILLIILINILCLSPVSARTNLVIVTPGLTHPMSQVAIKLLTEAYDKLGYHMQVKLLSQMLAYSTFDMDQADGYLMSDIEFSKEHPKSVMVNSPIGYDDIVVFTKNTKFQVAGWESLKPYSIGYNLGMVIIEKNLVKGMITEPSETIPQVFYKLDSGGTDIAVSPRGVGLMMIKNLKLKGIKPLDPPLQKVALYTFMNPRWSDLAVKLAAILDDMRKSGKIKQVTDQVEADFLK